MAESQPLLGRTISHYRIIEKLGAAVSALVYKAETRNSTGSSFSSSFLTARLLDRIGWNSFAMKRAPLPPSPPAKLTEEEWARSHDEGGASSRPRRSTASRP
ncbi:MAG: hypothetical protein ACRD3Q_07700 [Terriglobales bacterium]